MILAITYIFVSTLLVLGAVFFFSRALESLSHKGSQNSDKSSKRSQEVIAGEEPAYYAGSNRDEIIAKLERQFRSSPSSEL
jgi:hypothetical protein